MQEFIRGFSLRMEIIPDTYLVELQISKKNNKASVVITATEADIIADFFIVPIAEPGGVLPEEGK